MTLLGFPGNPLPIRAEMRIDGTWTDITSRIRLANEIIINGRGRANEQGRPTPCTCSFTVDNSDNFFSNRAPTGANYGLIPEYTPVRVGVTEDRSFAILDTEDGNYVQTTDKAVLDITTEIDIRIEYELDNAPDGASGHTLASKLGGAGQRSWIFVITEFGYLQFVWSGDGTSLIGSASTAPVSPQYGPLAARVTFDSDNGSGNRELKFYTASTIAGSWTQLGSTVLVGGTGTIFSSTAPLELGRINGGVNLGVSGLTGFFGRIYAFELYSGIASPTLVAEADIYNQPRGTTSFSDGLGTPNTWTVEGTAEITPDNRRFSGELVSITTTQDISGNDIYANVQAADVTRRLGRDDVVKSALSHYFDAFTSTGYWKCEDGTGATSLANSVARGVNGEITDVQFGTASDLPASAGTITVNSTSTRIKLTAKTSSATSYACFNWAMKMASVPGSSVTLFNLLLLGGSIGTINFSVTATTYAIAAYDLDNALITSSSTAWTTETPPNVWNLFRIQLSQSGGNVNLDLGWYHPGDNVLVGITTLTFAGTVGRFNTMSHVGATNNVGTQFAHFFMGQFFLDNTEAGYVQSASAFDGERAAARAERVGLENDIVVRVIGDTEFSEIMGPQPIDIPLNILTQCAETEAGTCLYPDRNSTDLVMRTHRSLLNQYGPSVAYSGELGPDIPRGTDDDGTLRNTVTARSPDGSTGFDSEPDGPLGTTNIGIAPGSIDRNPSESARLNDHASWDVFLGTWFEYRWTQVPVAFERTDFSGTAAKVRKALNLAALDVGDMLTMTGPPGWTPPDDVLLLIQGLPTEVLGNRKWRITWNTTPYGPYVVNSLTSTANSRYRAAAGGSGYVLASGIDDNDMSFTVTIPTGSKLWGTTTTKPGNFPQNVVMGGEVMTISGISGTSSPQTFTVSARGVNNISKSHAAGTPIEVQFPFYAGLLKNVT